ncbi:DUF5686 family protein [Maribacter antarcticus]|uniref:DUF5686 family protein n=1 Tax=Maribacter antarcticus TaxID=505250 RepID=UPI00047A6CDE|nr:DUF5686 family protein [Maribacter antarcticus]
MKAKEIHHNSVYIAIVHILLAQMVFAQNKEAIKANNRNAKQEKIISTIGVSQILFSGVLLQNLEKRQVWYIPNVFELFSLNTVEGFVVNPQVKFIQNFEDGRFYAITPNVRYGFGNERFQAQLKTSYFYNPEKKAILHLSGGRTVEQIYEESTLSAFNNTLYTFAFEENFLKNYERSYVALGHTFSPIADFLLTTTLSWNERNSLNNLPKYQEDVAFTPNNPKNIELDNTAFAKNKAVLFEAQLRWQIGHRYEKQRGQLLSNGKYPALTVDYTNALDDFLGSDIAYQKITFQVEDSFKIGKGYGKGHIGIGDFITKDNLTFVDFKHFKGKQTVYGDYSPNQFQLLEYYNYSTADFYFQGHYEHQFRPLKENGKSKFQPTAGINYLYTGSAGNYVELGVGMDKIFKFWRMDFYNSWREGNHDSFGVRVGATIF